MDLLGSSKSILQGIDIDVINQGPTSAHRECIDLTNPITEVEIDKALSSIHSSKASDIDGFNSFFYKRV